MLRNCSATGAVMAVICSLGMVPSERPCRISSGEGMFSGIIAAGSVPIPSTPDRPSMGEAPSLS